MTALTLYNRSRESMMRSLRDRANLIAVEAPTLNQVQHVRDFEFEIFGDRRVVFGEEAMKKFVDQIDGIPMPYFKRASQGLQNAMVAEGITKAYESYRGNSEPKINLAMLRTAENKPWRVLGVPNDRKPIIPLQEVVRACEAGVGKGHELNRWRLTDEGLTVSYTNKNVAVEPKVGDITQAGVEMFFSDAYQRNPEIHWFAFRLHCSNGMVLPVEGQRISIVGNTVDEILHSIETEAQRLMGSVEDNLLNPFAATAHEPVEDAGVFLTQIADDFRLHRNVRHVLMQNAASQLPAEPTQYDIINLLTALQHEDSLTDEERFAVQVHGATEAHDHYKRCSRCHSILN